MIVSSAPDVGVDFCRKRDGTQAKQCPSFVALSEAPQARRETSRQ